MKDSTRLAPAQADPDTTRRLGWHTRAIALSLGLLGGALGYTQVVRSAALQTAHQRQAERQRNVPAQRGAILDRHGVVLAEDRAIHSAVLWIGRLQNEFLAAETERLRNDGSDRPPPVAGLATRHARLSVLRRLVDRLSHLLEREIQVDVLTFEHHLRHRRDQPFVLAHPLAPEEAERLRQALGPEDAVQVSTTYLRSYPHGRLAAHVIGAVRNQPFSAATSADSDVSRRSLPAYSISGYSGMELSANAVLSGVPSRQIVVLDPFGFPVLFRPDLTHAIPGRDVRLGLDLVLQQGTENALDDSVPRRKAAAVALCADSGEVLALASRPAFDVSEISPALPRVRWEQIEAEGGWLNRATQGLYPPGSTFKPFTVLTALRRHSLEPSEPVRCAGSVVLGTRRFACHAPQGHGALLLEGALAQSCNVYAYTLGAAVGAEALRETVAVFQLDEPSGIELPGEARPRWPPAAALRDPAWTAGDTLHLAIGQGPAAVTPLQLATAYASLARNSPRASPTMFARPSGPPTQRTPGVPILSPSEHARLLRALRDVVRVGIGRAAQVPGVTVAGKSGTAQVARAEGMFNVAWFVAFAPVENPEIVVAVAVEGDRPNEEFAGAAHAAPIAGEIIATFFDAKRKRSPSRYP